MNNSLIFTMKETTPEIRIKNNDVYNMHNNEVLNFLISGSREEALNKATQLLNNNDLKALSVMDFEQLKKYGLSENTIYRIITAFELSRRLESISIDAKPKINSPEDVYRKVYPYYREIKKEIFLVFLLDTKNQIIKQEVVSIGSLNANIIHPREVFKPAIEASAAHIIVTHNHPSGDPTPSREDIEITKKLQEAGSILGITLLDHVIIGEAKHFSLKEAGHI